MMLFTVMGGTQRNQVLEYVVSQVAACVQLMDLQVDRRAAQLATPSVPFQHPKSKRVIFLSIELQSGLLLAQAA